MCGDVLSIEEMCSLKRGTAIPSSISQVSGPWTEKSLPKQGFLTLRPATENSVLHTVTIKIITLQILIIKI